MKGDEVMKAIMCKTFGKERAARNAWIAFGSLLALGLLVMTVRELPSMRRELRLMKM
jgi:hypothetical protein